MRLISENLDQRAWHQMGIYHNPRHAPASRKIEWHNGLLKTTLRAMSSGTFKHWDTHLAKATWLVNTRVPVSWAGQAQSKLLHTVEGNKVPVVHIKSMLRKTIWVISTSGNGKPIHGIAFTQGPGCAWWVTREEFTWWGCPMVGKSHMYLKGIWFWVRIANELKLFDVNCYKTLYIITSRMPIHQPPHWASRGAHLCHSGFVDLSPTPSWSPH